MTILLLAIAFVLGFLVGAWRVHKIWTGDSLPRIGGQITRKEFEEMCRIQERYNR